MSFWEKNKGKIYKAEINCFDVSEGCNNIDPFVSVVWKIPVLIEKHHYDLEEQTNFIRETLSEERPMWKIRGITPMWNFAGRKNLTGRNPDVFNVSFSRKEKKRKTDKKMKFKNVLVKFSVLDGSGKRPAETNCVVPADYDDTEISIFLKENLENEYPDYYVVGVLGSSACFEAFLGSVEERKKRVLLGVHEPGEEDRRWARSIRKLDTPDEYCHFIEKLVSEKYSDYEIVRISGIGSVEISVYLKNKEKESGKMCNTLVNKENFMKFFDDVAAFSDAEWINWYEAADHIRQFSSPIFVQLKNGRLLQKDTDKGVSLGEIRNCLSNEEFIRKCAEAKPKCAEKKYTKEEIKAVIDKLTN